MNELSGIGPKTADIGADSPDPDQTSLNFRQNRSVLHHADTGLIQALQQFPVLYQRGKILLLLSQLLLPGFQIFPV